MASELNEILSKDFRKNINDKYLNYKGFLVFDTYKKIADAIENFKVRDDDVWVCSFPRSGTTWVQEMVWNIANDSNFRGFEICIDERFPFLELPGSMPWWNEMFDATAATGKRTDLEYIGNIASSASPRFIKTHLPFQLLPRQLREREKNCKIIYVSRNPKDTCISYYHFYKLYAGYCGNLENFCKLFLAEKVIYAPYWTNVNSYLKRKDDNVLCVKFEDMKSDLRLIIRRVATFLGKTLNEEQTKKLQEHLSFARMEANPAVNYELGRAQLNAMKSYGENFVCEEPHMRSGLSGQWKRLMSEKLVKQFDDWIEENSDKL